MKTKSTNHCKTFFLPINGFQRPLLGQNTFGCGIFRVRGRGDHPQDLKSVATLVIQKVVEQVLARSSRVRQRHTIGHHLVPGKVGRLNTKHIVYNKPKTSTEPKATHLVVIFSKIVQETDQVEILFEQELATRYERIDATQVEIVGERVQMKPHFDVIAFTQEAIREMSVS